jgi:CelD/BcsL family acetyltransferase involved in cellulose biosynthesis
VLRDAGALAALRDEWHALLMQSGGAEVFQTHEWMSTWWEVFGDQDRELFVVTVRQGGRLVGLAPFLIRRIGRWSRAQVRRLEFLGTGEAEEDEVCSDFLDIVAAPAHRQRVSALVWRRWSPRAISGTKPCSATSWAGRC